MKNRILVAILPVLACFALLPGARAQCLDGCDSTNFNTFQGDGALINNTIGAGNAAFGWRALFLNTDGSFNTGVGAGALVLNTGSDNTAVGTAALLLNTTGADNVAVGTDALVFNDSGSENTAVGTFALENNTVDANTATGAFALEANTTGGTLETSVLGFDLGPNTAIGSHALENNVDASANTAVGYKALHTQVTGFTFGSDPHLAGNTAVGFEALGNLTGAAAGDNAANDGYGYQALSTLTDGDSNVAVGFQAGFNLASWFNNIYIGAFSGPFPAGSSENYVIRIGSIQSSCFIQGISGVTGANFTDMVLLDPLTGQLGDLSSSAQYKKEIQPMDKTSEAIFSLRPVTFHYKNDKTNTPQFGLIAEEVAKVNPALIGVDKEGKPYCVRYEQIDAMLLNEFLKGQKKVEEQQSKIDNQQASIAELKATVAQQAKGMEALTAQLKEQAAQIQKVSSQ